MHKCRFCGFQTDNVARVYAAANACWNCETPGSMEAVASGPSPTAILPRNCPEAVIAAFPRVPPGEVAAIYAKIIRYGEVK